MPKYTEENKFYDTYRKIRRDWGEIEPQTKIIPSKKQIYKRRSKYKKDYDKDYEN